MYQYTNAKGETFGIVHSESSSIAYINGSYVAEAETEIELEEILDHFSHANQETTKHYLGLAMECFS